MSKAEYQAQPKGHYGLVLKDYAHFTSPIRRYPDLAHPPHPDRPAVRHRQGDADGCAMPTLPKRSASSPAPRKWWPLQIERRARTATKAEYARLHIGECREGTISGVTQRGVFVELDNGDGGLCPLWAA